MSRAIIEPQRQIPVAREVDVLVIGGGPAGFAAAVSAARSGAQTLLIEQTGAVGGIATSGLMSHWTGGTEGPLYAEILERAKEPEEEISLLGLDRSPARVLINPERLKLTLLEMLNEAGVGLQLYTFASDAIVEEKRVIGTITESKSGRQAILAKVVIDASGDGDIAAKAGVEYFKGREEDGKMQPVTIMFKLAGVDTDRAIFPGSFETNLEVPAGKIQDLGKEHLPFPAGHVLLYRSTLPGVVTVNMTNIIDIDGTRAEDLTRGEYECRRQIDPIVHFLREYAPGYENCYVISSASLLGVRETRHFVGDYILTEQDILQARLFDDWLVTKAHFNFDVHNLTGAGLDSTGAQKEFKQRDKYSIPYGCFVPKGIDGLFLAGRNISGTHMAHSNFRVMPICVNMGQGVGTAAALCAHKDLLPRELDIAEVQEALKAQGVEP